MDTNKRNHLIEKLSREPEPQLVPIAEFFDGNDDLGSIGCNLIEHPGIDVFRTVFAQVALRPDVTAIYAQIAELDPGEGSWPFSDTVLVVGSIAEDELKALLAPLEPDEIGQAEDFGISDMHLENRNDRILVAWWD